MLFVSSSLLHHRQESHKAAMANRTYAHSNKGFPHLGKENMLNFLLCSLSSHELLDTYKINRLNCTICVEQQTLESIGAQLSDLGKQPLRKNPLSVFGFSQRWIRASNAVVGWHHDYFFEYLFEIDPHKKLANFHTVALVRTYITRYNKAYVDKQA